MNPKNHFKLSRGDSGQFVRELQGSLLESGANLVVDGKLGRITLGYANRKLKLPETNTSLSHGQIADLGVRIKFGIDLSGHNEGGTKRQINFDKVAKDGVDFVNVKLTEDNGYVNEEAKRQVHEAARVGILCGPYHFPNLSTGYDPKNGPAKDAEGEFEHFIKIKYRAASAGYWTLRSWLDVENGVNAAKTKSEDNYNARWYLRWLQMASKDAARRAGVYSALWAENSYFENADHELLEQLGEYPLWVASYNVGVQPARMPDTWSSYNIWQFNNECMIDGVDGKVDGNWSLEEDLLDD